MECGGLTPLSNRSNQAKLKGRSYRRNESGVKPPHSQMSQTYFITGAQGCIGSWIVKALAERGDTAVIFDRSEDARRLNAIMEPTAFERARFIAGDITDVAAVRSALESSGARRIIHLAGLQVPACKADPVAGAFVNVIGTLNVFESAKSAGAERVVYASSAAVFGDGDAG